ncbi:MAG TPA: D-alanyl-D-alanine carboxypeptidase/D-alanyl-D-alanine-endopeptidase [Nevskiales bacterium]|nr:D-alanyl-D-alanine carboxypeptidase/D-alanyl-D-alanine-endopeptidase [Nevskiales bacterium]
MKWWVLSLALFAGAAWSLEGTDDLVESVENSGIDESDLSLLAVEGTGRNAKVLLSLNPNKALIPASVTKLVTAAAALREFPPGTRFETRLLANGEQNDRILNGDLVLKGGGDPSFKPATLAELVARMARSGIREVRGDILVDDSYFDSVRIDASRSDTERVDKAYDAPVGAMSFNWNTVAVYVRPAEHAGQPARVVVEPASDYIRIRGEVKTGVGRGRPRVGVRRIADPSHPGDTIEVNGYIGQQVEEVMAYKNITQPDLWSGENLKQELKRQGIGVSGRVRRGTAAFGARTLASVQGDTVQEIIVEMNKASNNFVAEMLAKNLSAHSQPPGNLERGMATIREYMRSLGLSELEYTLVNPSGLTRDNKLSARALVRVLQDMGGNFQYAPEFMASLPIAGVDGTLRRRLRNTPAERFVRAKTGYVDDVITLAGYAGHRNGRIVTFAFLYNGKAAPYLVRKLYDDLCEELAAPEESTPSKTRPLPRPSAQRR